MKLGAITGLLLTLLVSPAISLAKVLVYMPLGAANAIAVVDADSGRVIAKIPGVINSHGLAITPDGSTMVAGSLTELGEAELPAKPEQMSAGEHRAHHSSPEQQQITVRQGENRGILYLIDVSERRILNQIRVPGSVHHNVITPDGKYAVSTHSASGLVSVVDINLSKVVKTIRTGFVPNYAVVSRDGSRIYVSNSGENMISEIDTESWSISRQLPGGDTPAHLALSADDQTLYVINVNSGKVSVLDLDRGEIAGSFAVGADPHGLALSRDGRFLFASSKQENRLVRIDLKTHERSVLSLSPAPYHVAVIPVQERVYVSSHKDAKVWVVDPVSLRVLRHIDLKQGTAHQMVSVIGK
jgi:YVTN family beta-propeller protein